MSFSLKFVDHRKCENNVRSIDRLIFTIQRERERERERERKEKKIVHHRFDLYRAIKFLALFLPPPRFNFSRIRLGFISSLIFSFVFLSRPIASKWKRRFPPGNDRRGV